MYDMKGIYDNVIRHEKLIDGTPVIKAPCGYGFGGEHNTDKIELMDSWRPEKKRAQGVVWEFTITSEGVFLKVYKKTVDSDEILAIAKSYHLLISLLEPYCDGVEYGE